MGWHFWYFLLWYRHYGYFTDDSDKIGCLVSKTLDQKQKFRKRMASSYRQAHCLTCYQNGAQSSAVPAAVFIVLAMPAPLVLMLCCPIPASAPLAMSPWKNWAVFLILPCHRKLKVLAFYDTGMIPILSMRKLKGSEILVIYNNKQMTKLGVKCRLISTFTY